MKFILLGLLLAPCVLAQTQTTGRIAGRIRDERGSLVVGADVTIVNTATGEHRVTASDDAGNFASPLLIPGMYRVRIRTEGFNEFIAENVTVRVTESTFVDTTLTVRRLNVDPVTVKADTPLIKADNPGLGHIFVGEEAAALPLATRNFTHLLTLVPGTSAFLADNTAVGRNSQNVSVNGARLSQNNFQINGIDSNFGFPSSRPIASPAPESIAELKIQTSVYDASFGRAGGGNVQVITRAGTNNLKGSIYDYFGDTIFNANNPFLKAAGQRRPILERNIFGITVGGAMKRDRVFFFASYQTARERNAASRLNSISSSVLIDSRLTDDRSTTTLTNIFGMIHPVSLRLLQATIGNGIYLIPTPQNGARYSGSAVSTFREEQFNLNFDFRLAARNLLSTRVFYSHAPQVSALVGNQNIPGFPTLQRTDTTIVSIQDIHSFRNDLTNEARIGFNLSDSDDLAQPPFFDSDVGIMRPPSIAAAFPGFPLINVAGAAGGMQFGTIALNYQQPTILTPTLANTISFTHQSHAIRAGLEFRYYLFNINLPIQTRGNITFADFGDFLRGIPQQTRIGSGITDRAFRAADYHFFVQDDWKPLSNLVINLGARYELNLPAYDTRGRIATFDPSLYLPPQNINSLPLGGIVQAGNPAPGYDLPNNPLDDLPDVPNVANHILKSLDLNNFAPRLGVAYTPFSRRPLVVRGGYGVYYSRSAMAYLVSNIFQPPFYFNAVLDNRLTRLANFSNPFVSNFPTQFPTLAGPLFGNSIDRNIRTPYFHQYNVAAQFEVVSNTSFEVAYVGSRGLNLFRQVAINQAQLTPLNNTPGNAQGRAPFQGVAVGGGFLQDQSTAHSRYDSLQVSLTRRLSRGLQLQASYTLAKSIDNASGGSGAGTNGLTDTQANTDTAVIIGNQLDPDANRGLSNYDRRHRFVTHFVLQVPRLRFANRTSLGRSIFSGWQISGTLTAMSGLPIDVVDSQGATLYLGNNGGGGRPSFVPGISPTSNVPNGYYFNPFAFMRPVVAPGQIIPSSVSSARAGATCGTIVNGSTVICSDFGNVGRNVLRGPRQFNTDVSVSKHFRIGSTRNFEFRTEFFNLFNLVNYANPISNLAAVSQSDGVINPSTGMLEPGRAGDFGRIISTSNNPRMIQLALKVNF